GLPAQGGRLGRVGAGAVGADAGTAGAVAADGAGRGREVARTGGIGHAGPAVRSLRGPLGLPREGVRPMSDRANIDPVTLSRMIGQPHQPTPAQAEVIGAPPEPLLVVAGA